MKMNHKKTFFLSFLFMVLLGTAKANPTGTGTGLGTIGTTTSAPSSPVPRQRLPFKTAHFDVQQHQEDAMPRQAPSFRDHTPRR